MESYSSTWASKGPRVDRLVIATAEGVSKVVQEGKNWFSYWHLYLDVAHPHLRHGHGSALVLGGLVEDSWSRFRCHDSIPLRRQRQRTTFVWALQTAPAARYREGARRGVAVWRSA